MFDRSPQTVPPKKPLKPLRLHELIGGATVWTDELWDMAMGYLLERVGTMQAIFLAEQLHHDGTRVPDYPHKVDFLREFRQYPPTVLLGAFDFMRVRKP
jgi:hypothetical protein